MSETTWSEPLSAEEQPGGPTPVIGGAAGETRSGSSTSVAKDQAAEVSQGAAEAGKRVAAVAGDQAGRVADQAKRQARGVIGQAGTQVREQAGEQQRRIAENLRTMSDQLAAMAEGSRQQDTASDLARQASIRAGEVASWLEQRDPQALVEEVRSFARRRPGTFLAIAAAAGVVAGRMTRGLTASGSHGAPEASAAVRPSPPRAFAPESGSPAGFEEIQPGVGEVGSAGYAGGLPPTPVPVEEDAR